MIERIDIVQGLFFGDEGKGKIVDWLCRQDKDALVVRYCGGPQSGHRVINNGKEHIFSSFGSGTLNGNTTFLDRDVYIDPICFMNEAKELDNFKVIVHDLCKIILPHDVISNIKDDKVLETGSCGKGYLKAQLRKQKILFEDIFKKDKESVKTYLSSIYDEVNNLYDANEYRDMFFEAISFIQECNVKDKLSILPSRTILSYDVDLLKYKHRILEGTQGILLDKHYGFMPYCTPSRIFRELQDIYSYYSELNGTDITYWFVSRLYTTRHGNGYDPQYHNILQGIANLDEPTNTDDGYQGKFKTGLFDLRLFKTVIDRTCLDNYKYYHPSYKFNLVLNHYDCFKYKISYINLNGQIESIHKDNISLLICQINSIFKFDNIYIGDSPTNIYKL